MEQTLPLADIHLPANISAWPPAIGWWLLALLGIAIIVGVFYWLKRHQKKWRYRRAALALLSQHYQTWQAQQSQNESVETTKNTVNTDRNSAPSTIQCATRMMAILKRTALTAYGYDKATLFGQAWVDFINQKTQQDIVSDELAEWMINQQYQKASTNQQDTVNITTLYRACEKWIKQHKSTSQQGSTTQSTQQNTKQSIEQRIEQRGQL
jgi:apolipoprotein N-acyltransferase